MDGCFGVGVVSMLDLLQTAEALREQMDPAIPRIDVGVVGTRPRVITGSGVVLQTTAGKMIFGRFDERAHTVYDKERERPQREAAGGGG